MKSAVLPVLGLPLLCVWAASAHAAEPRQRFNRDATTGAEPAGQAAPERAIAE